MIKLHSKIGIILISFTVIIAAFLAAYFLIWRPKTREWKIYQSDTANFSLKYPPAWGAREISGALYLTERPLPEKLPDMGLERIPLGISRSTEDITGIAKTIAAVDSNFKADKRKLNGREWTRFYYNELGFPDTNAWLYVYENNVNDLIAARAAVDPLVGSEAAEKNAETILSTLEIRPRELYRDPQGRYTLIFPNNWRAGRFGDAISFQFSRSETGATIETAEIRIKTSDSAPAPSATDTVWDRWIRKRFPELLADKSSWTIGSPVFNRFNENTRPSIVEYPIKGKDAYANWYMLLRYYVTDKFVLEVVGSAEALEPPRQSELRTQILDAVSSLRVGSTAAEEIKVKDYSEIFLPVSWPSLTAIDAEAIKLLPMASAKEARVSPVPVLLPKDKTVLANGQLFAVWFGYIFDGTYQGLDFHIEGKRFTSGDDLPLIYPPAKPDTRVRGQEAYYLTHGEADTTDISWSEYGVLYQVSLSHYGQTVPDNKFREKLRAVAENLVYFGGLLGYNYW